MKKVRANTLKQGQTVHLVYLDVSTQDPCWKIGTYRLYSDKEPLPAEHVMIENMPRSFFRDNILPPMVGKNRLFYSRRRAVRKCNRMNGVK